MANLLIRLNPGKYIITSIWNEYQVGRTITIKLRDFNLISLSFFLETFIILFYLNIMVNISKLLQQMLTCLEYW